MAGDIPTRILGSTGERVSIIGMGGAHVGSAGTRKAAVRLVQAAIDAGINFMDNCWDYHQGHSEEWMGEALAGGYRDRVFLMTKIDGRTAAAAAPQIDQSLKRLRTDRIDLIQLHEVIRRDDPDRAFAPGGAMEALAEAQRAGKIRYIGFTGHKDPDIHLQMLSRDFAWDAVQMPINVLDSLYPKSFLEQVLPVLRERGIGVLAMKPLAGGDIFGTGAISGPEALRFALSQPVDVVINGMQSPQDLQQALGVASGFTPMSPEETRELRTRMAPHAPRAAFERYKSTHDYDGTYWNPHWLETARL